MMIHHASLAVLLLAACAPALAEDCRHSENRRLQLDFTGVRTVSFDVGPHTLRVDAVPDPAGVLQGRACASNEDRLRELTVAVQRKGTTLAVRLARDQRKAWLSSGRAYLDLDATVPDNVLVQLHVGSGKAHLTGAAAASADLGSGEVDLRRIAGQASVGVGSGDVRIEQAGALEVLSIGSGDVEAERVRGKVEVGSIGSGDFSVRGAGSEVRIGSIGSGDANLYDIGGNVSVGSIGSGDLDVQGVAGDLSVSSLGSGDIDHAGVRGTVDLPRR